MRKPEELFFPLAELDLVHAAYSNNSGDVRRRGDLGDANKFQYMVSGLGTKFRGNYMQIKIFPFPGAQTG
jgi:hypothetical protein